MPGKVLVGDRSTRADANQHLIIQGELFDEPEKWGDFYWRKANIFGGESILRQVPMQ